MPLQGHFLKGKEYAFLLPLFSFLVSRIWMQWLELEQPFWTMRNPGTEAIYRKAARQDPVGLDPEELAYWP